MATNTQAAKATKTTNPTTNPVSNPMTNPMTNLMMMNHIADHLQFLALLTPRLSTDKLVDGDDPFRSRAGEQLLQHGRVPQGVRCYEPARCCL